MPKRIVEVGPADEALLKKLTIPIMEVFNNWMRLPAFEKEDVARQAALVMTASCAIAGASVAAICRGDARPVEVSAADFSEQMLPEIIRIAVDQVKALPTFDDVQKALRERFPEAGHA